MYAQEEPAGFQIRDSKAPGTDPCRPGTVRSIDFVCKFWSSHTGPLARPFPPRICRNNRERVWHWRDLLTYIGIEELGVKVTNKLDDVIENCDVIMLLRLQLERQKDKYLPSIREYAKVFGINKEKLKKARKNVLIMHPGPTNRGIELSAEVADGEFSVILDQVTNGVAIRMAILYLLLGTKEPALAESEV